MDVLKFRVRGQALTLINPNVNLIPVTDTVNQYLCQFEFSEDWDDLNKVVVFKNVSYNISKEVYLSTSNECYIPWEVLSNSGEIFLEVIGTEVRGEVVTVRIPSTLLGFKWHIQEGLLDVSANVSPTPDLFEQFVSSVRSDSIVAATARDEAVIARDVAVQSASDASASELAATSAAESAVNSASTASSAASSASESALSVAGVADETKSYAEIASAKAADASTQAEIAAGAKEDAVTAKAGAEAARDEAATSADLAQTTESHIKTMTVSAHSLAETEAPTVTKTDTSTGFALDFGIPKGATGPKGEDGDNIHYTWVKYADTPTSGMSDDPTGKAYIGIAYNKSTPVGSTVYSDYAWSRIKGEAGEDGYSPTVITGTASDGSTTLTVTNKDGSTTTTLADGKARADIDTISDKTRSGYIETLSGSGFVQSTETEYGGLAEVVVYGKSVQDGTPTPEAPVEIHSVENPKVTACGKNLLKHNTTSQTNKGITCTVNKDGSVTLNGTNPSWVFFNLNYIAGERLPSGSYVVSGGNRKAKLQMFINGTRVANDIGNGATFTVDDNATTTWLRVEIEANQTFKNETIYPMIRIANVDGSGYESYKGNTATLSGVVLRSIPNGTRDKLFKDTDGLWKVDRKCGVVDLGTLTWTYVSSGTRFNAELPQIKTVDSNATKTNILCSLYVAGSPNDTWNGKDKVISANVDSHVLLVRDTSYTDATTFKSAMSGVEAVYELATSTYETLSDHIQSELNSLITYNPVTNVMVLDGVTPDIDVLFWTRDYYVKSVAENAQEDIDNLEIGGRNLILDSNFTDVNKWFLSETDYSSNISMTHSSDGGKIEVIATSNKYVNAYYFVNLDNNLRFLSTEFRKHIQGGVWFTISCDIKINFDTDGQDYLSFDFRPIGSYVVKGQLRAYFPQNMPKNTWVRIKGSSYIDEITDVTIGKNLLSMLLKSEAGLTVGSVVEYRNVKLEIGNRATDWTPAPEDKADVPVLLWTNASPTSEFASQTISLDLSSYSAVEIEFKYSSTANSKCIEKIRKGESSRAAIVAGASTSGAYISVVNRTVNVTTNGVTFGNGTFANLSGYGEGATYMVPTKIYGIKGV